MSETFMTVTVEGAQVPISAASVKNITNIVNKHIDDNRELNYLGLVRRFPESVFIVPILIQFEPDVEDIFDNLGSAEAEEVERLALQVLKNRG